jgi:pimeloyl-ACP methyl ester carboxylesterase
MGLRIGRFVGAIAIISTVGACAGSSTTPSSAPSASAGAAASAEARDWVHDIDVGGRTLSLACVGPTDSGRPTVVFETGLGGDRGVWADVMTTLQETDRGCSYDRAGLGLSEPAPKPRTTGDQVEDLHSLLAAAGLKPPYILVGHSSGGWNVMVYGDKYPDDVSGVVMVDVRPPAFSERTAAALPPKSAAEPEAIQQARSEEAWEKDPSRNPEGIDLIRSAAEAGASKGFGDRPLVVLTAGDRAGLTEGLPAPLAKEFDSIWMELQTGLVGLSTKGSQQVVAGATHDMPFEKPDVIVDAIREVLDGSGG